MFLLIQGGDLYAPEPRGRHDVLAANGRIAKIGRVDRRALDALGVDYEVVDAAGCHVAPGLIDAHEHLLGGSGEGSLALQTPMLFPSEIVRAGITTVVGTLGVDTTIKTIEGLLGRVKVMAEEGLSGRMWTGGYNVPPTTLLGSVRSDMLFVDEVIGCGEVAISDERGLNQSAQELAKLVRDTHVGGLLSGKCGRTHFHVGEEGTRLQPLRDLIEQFQVKADWLYPTHVQRTERLLREAIALAKGGAFVDMDAVNQDYGRWVPMYLREGGPPERLTLSSDADSVAPDVYYRQLRELVTTHGLPLETVLRFATVNPAAALELRGKGRLEEGMDADLLIVEAGTLEIRDVVARGRRLVADGQPTFRERFLAESYRRYDLVGAKAPAPRELPTALGAAGDD